MSDKEIDKIKSQIKDIQERLSYLEATRGSSGSSSPVSVGGIIWICLGVLFLFSRSVWFIAFIFIIIGGALIASKAFKYKNPSPITRKVVDEEIKKENRPVTKKTPDPVVKTEVHKEKPKKSMEELIGAGWLGIIGIAALVIGIAFFIFMENNGLTYTVKVLLGTLFGVLVIFFGDWFSKKKNYDTWGQILAGGGFAITYFSVYSAHFVYKETGILSQSLDSLFLIIVALAAILYSALKNSKIVAIESFILGYTAAFLSPIEGFMILLYGLILSIATMFVQVKKGWKSLSYYTMSGTYLLYFFWSFQNSNFWLGVIFLITYFLAFNVNIWTNIKEESGIVASNIINGIVFFFASWLLLYKNSYADHIAWISLGLAAFYGLLYLSINRKESFSNVYPGIFFLSLFVVLKINDSLVTTILMLLTLLFAYVGNKYEHKHIIYSYRILAVYIIIRTLTLDLFTLQKFDSVSFFSSTALLSGLFSAIGINILGWMDKKDFSKFLKYASSGMFIIIIMQQLSRYTTLVTLLFIIFALIHVFLKSKESSIQGIIFYSVAGFKTLVWDIAHSKAVEVATSFYKTTITSLIPIVLASYVLRVKTGMQFFSWAGTFFATILVLVEFSGFSVSALWAVLGLILLLAGFKFNAKELRIQGIILFGITIIKVFTIDTVDLDPVYRTLSFIALGIILIIASFLYAKNKEKIKEMI